MYSRSGGVELSGVHVFAVSGVFRGFIDEKRRTTEHAEKHGNTEHTEKDRVRVAFLADKKFMEGFVRKEYN
jgi:hypothetical protein